MRGPNLQGGRAAGETLNIPPDLDQRCRGLKRLCVCVCRVGMVEGGGRRRPQPADHVGRRALWSQRRGECEGVNWDSE